MSLGHLQFRYRYLPVLKALRLSGRFSRTWITCSEGLETWRVSQGLHMRTAIRVRDARQWGTCKGPPSSVLRRSETFDENHTRGVASSALGGICGLKLQITSLSYHRVLRIYIKSHGKAWSLIRGCLDQGISCPPTSLPSPLHHDYHYD